MSMKLDQRPIQNTELGIPENNRAWKAVICIEKKSSEIKSLKFCVFFYPNLTFLVELVYQYEYNFF
jgi:hypothetical protein